MTILTAKLSAAAPLLFSRYAWTRIATISDQLLVAFTNFGLTLAIGRTFSHQDLAAYDPALFAMLARVYGSKHRLKGDPFWMSPARVPPGPPPENTAEVC